MIITWFPSLKVHSDMYIEGANIYERNDSWWFDRPLALLWGVRFELYKAKGRMLEGLNWFWRKFVVKLDFLNILIFWSYFNEIDWVIFLLHGSFLMQLLLSWWKQSKTWVSVIMKKSIYPLKFWYLWVRSSYIHPLQTNHKIR